MNTPWYRIHTTDRALAERVLRRIADRPDLRHRTHGYVHMAGKRIHFERINTPDQPTS